MAGAVYSAARPTHGHQLTGTGLGGSPSPHAQLSCPQAFLEGMATCGVLVAYGVRNMAGHRQGRSSRQEMAQCGVGTAHMSAYM